MFEPIRWPHRVEREANTSVIEAQVVALLRAVAAVDERHRSVLLAATKPETPENALWRRLVAITRAWTSDDDEPAEDQLMVRLLGREANKFTHPRAVAAIGPPQLVRALDVLLTHVLARR
jgi:hypothetical protein